MCSEIDQKQKCAFPCVHTLHACTHSMACGNLLISALVTFVSLVYVTTNCMKEVLLKKIYVRKILHLFISQLYFIFHKDSMKKSNLVSRWNVVSRYPIVALFRIGPYWQRT